ncbi:hypothetical protein O6H91_08G080200 [Diphasiastrum complanatum]|uniref:Uncharacterized protein n=1 Tax=Diphasiastrum complanatum TaxID=34168 RepID=A0ACC2D073_DIPCM|nr:hypothetical protein O6H91_Y174400 [Diphasiastrum complanatum]KAJ7547322.1 hypothetical protein O6H91_08G080200 [Diphasiastrum complanatum]
MRCAMAVAASLRLCFSSLSSSSGHRHRLPSALYLTAAYRRNAKAAHDAFHAPDWKCSRRGMVAASGADAAGSSGVIKIAAISGSLRRASFHAGMIRAAIEIAKENIPDVEIEVLKIGDLPFVNTDLEVDGRFPEVVERFRAKVLQADSILFACPEYNYSMSAVFKNSIDWASRAPNVWAEKPAAIMSAGGNFGGGRSSYHLRQSGVFCDLRFINKPEVFVRAFEPPAKFDADGNLIDSATKDRIKDLLFSLRSWTLRLKSCS